MTVEEVARAAGVSEQTVFNYFPAKEDLVFDRVDEVEQLMIAAVQDRPADTTLVAASRALTTGSGPASPNCATSARKATSCASCTSRPSFRPTRASSARGSPPAWPKSFASRSRPAPTTPGLKSSPSRSPPPTIRSSSSPSAESSPASTLEISCPNCSPPPPRLRRPRSRPHHLPKHLRRNVMTGVPWHSCSAPGKCH